MMKIGKSLAAVALGTVSFTTAAVAADTEYKWSNVSMGGGGFVSAVIASPVDENLFYARTDVGGAYRWNNATSRWESMMDWVDVTERGLLGIEAIAVDPQKTGTVYMMAGTSYWNSGRSAFLRSSDRGSSWELVYTWDADGSKGGTVQNFGMHGNGMGRGNGEALAVDPNNSDNMFYGTKNKGLWKSTDNGSTWSHVSAWTTAAGSDTTWNGSGFSFVQYAPGSSDVIYAGFLREGTKSNGTFENVFTSTDGGATWTALPIPDALRSTAGGGIVRLMPQRAVVASDGSFLMVTFADGAGPHTMAWDEGWGMIYDGFGRGAVLKYDVASKTWSDVSPENLLYYDGAAYDETDYASGKYEYCGPYGGIAINPNNSKEIVVTTEGYTGAQYWKLPGGTYDMDGQWGTQIYYSTDGGENWVQSFAYNVTTVTMNENGIGWMNNSSIHWSGSAAIDPFDSKRVFVSSGNGVFRTDDITDYTLVSDPYIHAGTRVYDAWGAVTNNQEWKVSSHGVEETVPYEVVSIPGGPLVSVIADYDGFRHDDIAKYPSTRHTTSVGSDVHLGSTWGLAYAYKSGKLVKVSAARVYEGKYSSVPYAPLQYSTDSATTWAVETYTGPDTSYTGGTVAISTDGAVAVWVPGSGTTKVMRNYNSTTWENVSGIDANSFVVGDPENAKVFYAYDRTTGSFYKSSDQGASFSSVSTPGKSNFKKFRAIPGYEGDLWLPIGLQDENGNPSSGKLLHSTDGGSTWSEISGVGYCEAVGFGAPKTKGDYPAIYVQAKIDGTNGVFGSDDKGATWNRVNDDAHEFGGLANGEFVMGDMNTYGVVYMSTAGRGVAARVPSDWDMGSSESSSALKPANQESSLKFSRFATIEGSNLNLTVNNARVNVALYDLKGNRLFSRSYTSSTVVPLNEMAKARGAYVVRVTSGSTVMLSAKVNLH
ncbi:MAG: hypothetical protein J6Z31_01860 [Fibrobacter sp.]|nr:hypothetical protein [Fibrobacter sp.]